MFYVNFLNEQIQKNEWKEKNLIKNKYGVIFSLFHENREQKGILGKKMPIK